MTKKVAIVQSNYIPWKGYFDMINMVDEFVFHDDLQYTKDDWRNRNKIKTPKGLIWLTIPCGRKEDRLINEVEIKDSSWQRKHWNLIRENYQKAKYFKEYKDFFEEIYLQNTWTNLSELNQTIIIRIAREILGIQTEFSNSTDYNHSGKKSEKVLSLCISAQADTYLSGPSAKDYLDIQKFQKKSIDIEWMDYSGYPEYKQLYPPFEHGVSIIDLIFNEGANAIQYMKSFKS